MTTIGTPLSVSATRVLMCGCGELGKEVVIELQRLGCEVIAVDRYDNAPAMQVAHRHHVIDMGDGEALRRVIESERPALVVPEIEAIATATLVELEAEGYHVVPTARAAQLTMDREGIRRLAAETLGLPTSAYRFADTLDEYRAAVAAIGMPCVVKPVMSSSRVTDISARSTSMSMMNLPCTTCCSMSSMLMPCSARKVAKRATTPFWSCPMTLTTALIFAMILDSCNDETVSHCNAIRDITAKGVRSTLALELDQSASMFGDGAIG